MSFTVAPPIEATHTSPPYCSPGMVQLASLLNERWPVLLVREGGYGCYNRRPITGSTTKSVHGDGRALDVGIGWFPTVEQHEAIYELSAVLTAGCYEIGVQRMLWSRHAWRADRGWRRSDSMGGPHLDHMHLELTHQAAWSHPAPLDVVRCALGLPVGT